MARILVVDDEQRIRKILTLMLSAKDHRVDEAADGTTALAKLDSDAFDLVITDIRMEGMNGEELLIEIRNRDIGCPVVFITAYATLESAVEALRLGAADYLVKPFEERQIHLAVERALGMGRIMAENLRLRRALRQDDDEEAGVFVSPAMQQVREMALKVAPREATVLLTGESGTGKEVVAHLIHRASDRGNGRFVAVNCAAISPTLVESELFGHEKGAFTGANRRKEGKFEFADNGTLFLDEVGDLPLEAQSKVLRTIQEKTIQRVGDNRDIPVNARLICATNQNLENLVERGRFRQDLYYRIAVFPIRVPPLRERIPDIIPLATQLVKRFATLRELAKEVLTPGAARILTEYPWPGNVRELANAIERVAILKAGSVPITSDDLDFLRLEKAASPLDEDVLRLPVTGINFDRLQRSIIRQALEVSSGNQSKAARLLGLTRSRFRTFIKLVEGE